MHGALRSRRSCPGPTCRRERTPRVARAWARSVGSGSPRPTASTRPRRPSRPGRSGPCGSPPPSGACGVKPSWCISAMSWSWPHWPIAAELLAPDMMAQQTKARMAERGCRRPCRLRGSGTSARKESRLPRRDTSMRRLHATLPQERGLPSRESLLLFPQDQTVKSPGGGGPQRRRPHRPGRRQLRLRRRVGVAGQRRRHLPGPGAVRGGVRADRPRGGGPQRRRPHRPGRRQRRLRRRVGVAQ